MAVEKFRTFEEASLALARRRGSDEDTQLAVRVAAIWAMSAALAGPLECRGVRKFRSIEEADADRVRMTLERPREPPPRVG